tara:strand:+ start:631 stop:1746 length:1116 start_codon:yes stop_codon:yes gene_type:complete
MRKIIVKNKLLNTSYPIFIGNKIFNDISHITKSVCPKINKIAVIFDKNVPLKFLKVLKKKFKFFPVKFIFFKPNEKNKSLKSVNSILNEILKFNLNRNDLIISIGGGITGDVSSFVASIYKRGINYINVPTTLLAMVDSSIGGKTGVNSKYGKNSIGSFYQPELVLIDNIFLKSLNKRQMICGYAEILKHSIINDKNFFNWLKLNSEKIFKKEKSDDIILKAIIKSCIIKSKIVSQDFQEKKLRMILNFGHTFAHAIEIESKYSNKINHGEAVLMGMLIATIFSVKKKICSKSTLGEILNIYKKNNLNYIIKKTKILNLNRIYSFLKYDKKNNDKKVNLILIKKIGKTTEPGSHKYSIIQIKKTLSSFKLF